MAAIRLSSVQLPSSTSTSTSLSSKNGRFAAVLQAPMHKLGRVDHQTSLQKFLMKKMQEIRPANVNGLEMINGLDSDAISKLYAVAEVVADRAEMHANIGEQRADWNKLLLGSINSITLAAATMAGLSAMAGLGTSALTFKVSATILYSAATGLLMVVNKIQPSQLAEEQRNAARLFRQLLREIKTQLTTGIATCTDVDKVVERILALDKAYPLPLLPGMLEKFPAKVEPTKWWPAFSKKSVQQQYRKNKQQKLNGWSGELEEEMRGVLSVLKKKDVAEYTRLSKLVLKVNKVLAFSGPFLTGLAAVGTSLIGFNSSSCSSAALMVAVASGAMAAVVNTLEHGGQVGMVFEMYCNCGGFYHLLEETIESTLKEEVEIRENGELFEIKLALQLGRSVSELRDISSSLSMDRENCTEFAGKLF